MFRPMAVPVAGAMNNGGGYASPNAGMSSGRIDIEGQMGVCDRGGVRVSRAQPAVLAGQVTDDQWNAFCDKCDEAIAPVQKVKDLNLAFVCISAILLLVVFIGGMVMIARVADWNRTNDDESFWIFMLVAISFILIGGFAITAYGRSVTFQVRSALQRVCDDVSAEHSNVSFHVKFEAYTLFRGRDANTMVLNYIEVNIKDPEGGGAGGGGGPQVVVNVNAPGGTAETTTAATTTEATPVVQGTAVPEQAAAAATSKEEDDKAEEAEEEIEVKKEDEEVVAASSDEKEVEEEEEAPEQSKTAAERLKQLEGLKDLLTEDEYNEKRKEILETV
mmetsp:Transcript_43414/g.80785  ORF Transcript_43414/g.80785 Transcript_43414/m.80785 type:complete len:332 (-) Transcript_43414:475-1470(-)